MLGSSISGAGSGAGGWKGWDGSIGSIIPGPVQPLSEKSLCSNIRVTPPRVLSVGVAYSLPALVHDASDDKLA